MMRKARYDMRQVICRNSSLIGYSTRVARPGYWIVYRPESNPTETRIGRVLGRIAETDRDGTDCEGWIAAIRLSQDAGSGFVDWINPDSVMQCESKPPAQFLAWITGDDWVRSARDIGRIVAMSQHGTLSDSFIASRNDPDKAYNARPEYVTQFILRG